MGKKKIRSKVTSSGERASINKSLIKSIARDKSVIDKALNKLYAWEKGKNPWITIPNPTGPSNMKFVRVRANNYYGDYKYRNANIYRGKNDE